MPRRRPGVLLPLEVGILEVGVALQKTGDSFYGFAVARELASAEGETLTAHGTLYKALNRMAVGGLLESEWEDPAIAESEKRPRRRLYRVTAKGALALATQSNVAPAASPSSARMRLA
jgi:PadR family transcriptional regulator, regulatory protein PadR